MDSRKLFLFIDGLREKRGWTVYKLSKKAGISQGTIYTWRKRGTLPSLLVLESLCNTLDISLSNFFEMVYDTNNITIEEKTIIDSWKLLTICQRESIKSVITAFLTKEG